MIDGRPDFGDKDYDRGCDTCAYGKLKKSGPKVLESDYFFITYQCIAPLPFWIDRPPTAQSDLQVVVEADLKEDEYVPSTRVKYVMTIDGYIMADGACRMWKVHPDYVEKAGLRKAVVNFLKNIGGK